MRASFAINGIHSVDPSGLMRAAATIAATTAKMQDILDGKPGKGKNGCDGSGNEFVQPGEKDTQVQLVISLSLGLTAFVAFCVSRSHISLARD